MDAEKDELPQGWAWARLEDLKGKEPNALTDGPFGSKLKTEHYVAEGVRVVRLGNIGVGQFVRTDKAFITEEHFSDLRKHQVFPGDLIIAALAEPVGRCCEVPEDLGTAIVKADCIRFKPLTTIDHRFVMHWLNSPQGRDTVEAMAHGVGRLRVNMKELRAIPVPVAPAAEQVRIADKIDELFSDIAEGERGLRKVQALLKKHRQAVLKAAVTGELTREWREHHGSPTETGADLLTRILAARRAAWEADQKAKAKAAGKTLKGAAWKAKYEEPVGPETEGLPEIPDAWTWASFPQLGDFGRGKSKHRPRNDPALYGGPYPFLQTGVVRSSQGRIRTYQQSYNEIGLAQSRLWPKGTLCITIAANIAETGVLDFDACFPDSIVGLVTGRGISTIFVEFFVRTAKQNIAYYAPATAQKNINLEILSEVAVPLPSEAEQILIVDRVEEEMSKIDAMEAVVEAELKRADRLRQTILKSAFTGKLVPQNPADEPADALLARLCVDHAASPQAKRRGRPPKPAVATPSQPARRRGRPKKVIST